MPDEVAAVPAAPAAPQATPPLAAPSSPGAQRAESFDQTMHRLGGYSPPPSDSDEAQEAPQAAPVVATEPDPKAKGKAKGKAAKPLPASPAPVALVPPVADAPGAVAPEVGPAVQNEIEQLAALAKKLGFEIDAGKVTVAERARLREQKRQLSAQISQQEQSLTAKFQTAYQQLSGELADAREVRRVLSELNPDEIARVAGFKTYDEYQAAMLAKATDPNYKRIRELELRDQQREEQRLQAEAQQRTAQAQQQQAQREQTYISELSNLMKASKNPVVAGLHDDPRFVRTVMEIQRENYDKETRSTLSPEQAIKVGLRGAQRALEDEMRQVYDRLHRVFGAPVGTPTVISPDANPPPVADDNRPGAKPRPKTQIVPPAAVEAAPSKKMNKKEFAKYAADRLRDAIEQDKLSEFAQRRSG